MNNVLRIPPPDGSLVAVAMSGGVDSSVAAALLAEAGHRVVGLTMKLWDASKGVTNPDKTCCTLDSSLDAKRICEQLGIPHYTLDMVEDFEERVVEPFYQSYREGKTPNPCVNCNSFVKWDALWRKAKALGAKTIATGHYAHTVLHEDGRRYICRAEDRNKDQSYFLWGIPADALQATWFPLEGLSKPEVRDHARRLQLRTAEKSESMDICFIPDGDKDRFLRERAAQKGDQFEAGEIRGPEGQKIGQHQGLPFYTVGQRKGLGVATGEPVFVREIDRSTNTLWLGRRDQILCQTLTVEKLNWFEEIPSSPEGLRIQVRYRSRDQACQIEFDGTTARIVLDEPALAPSAGQSAVFYLGDRVLGGGIIQYVEMLPAQAQT
jgi:tRNA-specific 2-thiouridylase